MDRAPRAPRRGPARALARRPGVLHTPAMPVAPASRVLLPGLLLALAAAAAGAAAAPAGLLLEPAEERAEDARGADDAAEDGDDPLAQEAAEDEVEIEEAEEAREDDDADTAWRWSAEEQAYLDARGPIRVCVDPAWPPLERITPDGRYEGIGADVLDLLARRGGLRLELVPTTTWAETLALAEAGGCDLLPVLTPTEERRAWLDFTATYLDIPGVIVARTDAPHVTSIGQLLDRPLGALRGYSSVAMLRAEYPGIQLVEVDSYEQGLGMVQSGELYGMLGNMAGLGQAMQASSIVDLKIAGWTGVDTTPAIATRRSDPVLGKLMQRLVASLAPADTQAILNRWLAVRFEQGFDYRLFWRGLAIAGALGLLLLAWAMSLRRVNRKLAEANARLGEANRRDPLTRLHNRMHLDLELAARVHLCARNRLTLAVAVIDIDHFKQVNDRFGHPFGDAALRAVADQLAARFRRDSDLVVRYGGEEFVAVVTGGSPREAVDQLEGLRAAIAAATVAFGGQQTRLTVSIGVQLLVPTPADTPASLIEAADAALYQAKREGRDRVVLHPVARAALEGAARPG